MTPQIWRDYSPEAEADHEARIADSLWPSPTADYEWHSDVTSQNGCRSSGTNEFHAQRGRSERNGPRDACEEAARGVACEETHVEQRAEKSGAFVFVLFFLLACVPSDCLDYVLGCFLAFFFSFLLACLLHIACFPACFLVCFLVFSAWRIKSSLRAATAKSSEYAHAAGWRKGTVPKDDLFNEPRANRVEGHGEHPSLTPIDIAEWPRT